MTFTYKTEKEIAELSEYQREKYFDQKREFEANQAKEAAEKAATEKANEVIESAKKDFDAKLEEAKKAQEDAIEAQKADLQSKIDELTAKLQRTNFADRQERIKTMSELIEAKLSTEEGEKMLKDFANGAKAALNTEIEVGKATFLKPTANGGYVAPEMSGIYGQGH